MPKMKTKSSAKKRFKVTKKGKVKAGSAFTSHMMMNKPNSMKRKSRRTMVLSDADARIVLRNFLPYGRKKAKKARKTTSEGAS
ncbi:MAG: 50S ribosomal protein L35 [Alphaproteobacteria bacterium]|nr:50S ribosomal protein L35 [Alphaproteobacteria bacterium]